MEANLNSDQLDCTGKALVKRKGRNCWTWQLQNVKCTGKRSVDWLHSGDQTGTVCKVPAGWQLEKTLPGRSNCVSEPVFDGERLTGLDISCSFMCLGAEFPCNGEGAYHFQEPRQSLRRSGR